MYGWRKRIGLIVPSTNTTCEMEFHKLLPPGVSVHTSRVFLPENKSPEDRIDSIIRMGDGLLEGARLVSGVGPDILVWACTVGSFIKGKGYDTLLAEKIKQQIGLPLVTTSTAIIEAFKTLKVKKIAMATPYIDEINRKEKEFFEHSLKGLKVVNMSGLGIISNLQKGQLTPESAYVAARQVHTASSECILISCTNWRTLEIIDVLEKDLGKPVVSSVQATIWLTFKMLGLSRPQGFGCLLQK
jgi:maleate isomerase